MPNNTVYVIGGDNLVSKMFKNRGWEVWDSPENYGTGSVDFLVFTGGADVSPELYGERNTHSSCNVKRDLQEVYFYNNYSVTAKLGICRGAQFLNVMAGGKMLQHIPDNSHCSGNHKATFQYYQQGKRQEVEVEVTSTHHQGIIIDGLSDLVGWTTHAHTWDKAYRSSWNSGEVEKTDGNFEDLPAEWKKFHIGVEAFRTTTHEFDPGILGFQPHPEYGHKPTEDIFFTLIASQFRI